MKKTSTADEFFAAQTRWSPELLKLREILTGTGLDETVKWGSPCYTHKGSNVVGVSAFKSYFGLWFFQGALLADKAGVLINAQKGKTRAMRQWRMASARDIQVRTIRAYVREAIGLAESGRRISPRRGKPVVVPPELQTALAKNRDAQAVFELMMPGKRREYADYISDARRDTTKQKRLEKIVPMIAAGLGLNDRYRSG